MTDVTTTTSARSRPWRAPPGRPSKARQSASLRDPLRKAIAGAREAEAALVRHRQAIERAKVQIGEAERALKRQRDIEADSKQRTAEELAVSLGGAIGRERTTPLRPLLAEDRTREAERAVEIAKAAFKHLEDTRVAAQDAVAAAESNVLTEVNKLLAPLVARLLAECESARRRFITARIGLRALSGDFRPLPAFSDAQISASIRAAAERDAALGQLKNEAERAGRLSMYRDTTEESETEYRLLARWRDAREALRLNADAELPEIG